MGIENKKERIGYKGKGRERRRKGGGEKKYIKVGVEYYLR